MKRKKSSESAGRDKSPYVSQPDKIKESLEVRKFDWTDKQKEFMDIALDKKTKVMLIKGPAGSSKTLLSVCCALNLLNEKKVGQVLYIRSAVEASESKIGYLPGTVEEKLAFYNMPLVDKMVELLPKSQIDKLLKEEKVKSFPINFARGMSWNATCILFDEAQNSSIKEIITVLTRVGQFSKCFLLADPSQTDLNHGKGGGFERLWEVFHSEDSIENGIRTFEFSEDDIMRSELVKFIVKKLKLLPPATQK
jgi:phosphate starvation-inducible PhoH-like protein